MLIVSRDGDRRLYCKGFMALSNMLGCVEIVVSEQSEEEGCCTKTQRAKQDILEFVK